jgi:MSMEG_0570 family protein
MPEVIFTVQLPDGTTKECYSPSTIVHRYFVVGEEMPVAEFLQRSRAALAAASERVRAKFGYSCSSASAQLAEIERWISEEPSHAIIRIISV